MKYVSCSRLFRNSSARLEAVASIKGNIPNIPKPKVDRENQ
jgi:hypothetical protein